jgi:hypothetical protein
MFELIKHLNRIHIICIRAKHAVETPASSAMPYENQKASGGVPPRWLY